MEFDDATRLDRIDATTYAWDVPDGWQQGRGAWGGLVTGAVTRAIALHEPDAARPIRTASIHMSGPVLVGPATVEVQPVRIGSGMSTWSVTITDVTGGLCVHAVVITGAGRAPDLASAYPTWGIVRAPELPSWISVPAVPSNTPGMPPFASHVEFRVVTGAPVSGGPARCAGWLRLADQQAWTDVHLLSIVDGWWPTALAAADAWRPTATVSFAAHLLVDPATVPAGEPLAMESFMSAAREGFTSETRRLWTADGRLAVENHQSIVVIR